MTEIVDRRRRQDDDAIVNRRRFLNRNKKHIRKAVEKSIGEGSIKDIGKKGTDVHVQKDTLKQPIIHHGKGGKVQKVFPWNKKFKAGDKVPVPKGGGGATGPKGSKDGEGEDDFVFHINEEEFLNYIFDDLELPDLIKRSEEKTTEVVFKNVGYTKTGSPSRISVRESFKQKKKRTLGADNKRLDKIFTLLEEAKSIYKEYDDSREPVSQEPEKWKPKKIKVKDLQEEVDSLKEKFNGCVNDNQRLRLSEIEDNIEGIENKRKVVNKWNENTDLKYRAIKQEEVPSTNAVMFCMMDVSGSMNEEMKNNAKIFYFMLYQFLKRQYEKTDIVFIRHHSEAKEVDEKEFFYSKETGGTVVSTALEKMQEIVDERYSSGGWNVYAAQASDGDNFGYDNPKTGELLEQLVKQSQAYFYTEVKNPNYRTDSSDIWDLYESVKSKNPNKMYMGKIFARNDVLKVFRGFFKKKTTNSPSNKAAAFNM